MRALIGAVLAWLCCAPAVLAQAPVEAYGRLPAVMDAAISPDGQKVILARSLGGQSAVQVYDVARNQTERTATVDGEVRLRGVSWIDDNFAAFLVSRTFSPTEVLPGNYRYRGAPRRVDFYRNGVLNLETGRIEMLTTNEAQPWADQGARLIAPIEDDPGFGRLIGRALDPRNQYPVVFRVNLATGSVRPRAPRGANDDTLRYLLDRRGNVLARVDSDDATNRWRLFVYDGETPPLLFEDVSEFGIPVSIAGLLPDGRFAVFDYDDAGELYALYAINPQSGARELLFAQEGRAIETAIIDPWTREVVGASWIEDERRQHFFDPALNGFYQRARAVFADGVATLVSWSSDRARFVVYAERGLDGGAYYLFTPAANELRLLARVYPELEGVPQGERLALTYRARDGQAIPAYLSLPHNQLEARGLPLVVVVHGGPAARDTLDFDYIAAFLASRGYAVLQPNFRGSSGYGWSWERAGHGQWGGLMQTDVEDGVAALGRSGRIDPARVCIVGASYGGYAALAGATLTPERYACAASIAGISDLEEMLRVERAESGRQSIAADYWASSIGHLRNDRDAIRAMSPINLIDRVRAPILLMHGTDDTVVRIDQSRRMQRALNAAGKPVRFVELRGDDHYLSDAETRIQMLRELETFLAAHLGAAQ